MRRANWILGMGLMLAGVASAGQVYKWTDDKGRVHYSDKPIPKAQKLDVRVPGTAPPASSGGGSAGGVPDTRAEDCKRMGDQLTTYKSAARVVERDSLGREKEFSADERARLIQMTEQRLATECTLATEGGSE